MLFSEIIGQEEAKIRLRKTVHEQRIPHAQLFCGPEGVGKLQLAIAYAQYIACTNRTETDSCGHCPSCVKFAKLQHPDLHFAFPVIKPKNKTTVVCDDYVAKFRTMILDKHYFDANQWYACMDSENKQGWIFERESAEISRKLSFKAYESEYKTMIIWLPERMNDSCANKLLKLLEEPPEKTVFLLVSNTPEQLLATIISRTQRVAVPRLTDIEIARALRKQNPDLSYEQADTLAHSANGSYLLALQFTQDQAENNLNFERFTNLMRWAWLIAHRKDYDALINLRKWSEDMASSEMGRERQKQFLNYLQRMVRESYIANLHNPQLNYMTIDEGQFSARFSPFINERNVEEMMNEIDLAQRQIEQNVNAKMVFFGLSLKMIVLIKR